MHSVTLNMDYGQTNVMKENTQRRLHSAGISFTFNVALTIYML